MLKKTNNIKAFFINEPKKLHEEYVAIGADLKIYVLDHFDASSTYTLNVYLRGKSRTEIRIAVLNQKNYQKTFNINVYHESLESESVIEIKVVGLNDSKTSVKVHSSIAVRSSRSSTYQTIQGILLGKNATISGDPTLAIDNNEIKAKHAFSVGSLSKISLNYLMSRGVDELTARDLIIMSLFEGCLMGFEDEVFRNRLKNQITDYVKNQNF